MYKIKKRIKTKGDSSVEEKFSVFYINPWYRRDVYLDKNSLWLYEGDAKYFDSYELALAALNKRLLLDKENYNKKITKTTYEVLDIIKVNIKE